MIDEIRRHEALRSLPLWICVGALIILLQPIGTNYLISFMRQFGVAKEVRQALWVAPAVALWCALAPYLAGSHLRRRCRRFDMALPIPARRLWLAQVTAVLLGAAAVLAAPTAFLVLVVSPTPGELLRWAAHLGAGTALAVAVLQAAKPALATLRLSWGYVLLTVGSLGGGLWILGLLRSLSLFWTLVPLGLAVALAVRTHRSLPAAFTLVPLAAQSGGAAGRLVEKQWTAAIAAGGAGGRHHWQLLRQVSGGPLSWLGWPLMFTVGLVVALLLTIWAGVPYVEFGQVLHRTNSLVLFSMFMFSILKMTRLPSFDPLPIGRRVLFAALILPGAAVLALGYGAGRMAIAFLVEWDLPDAGPALPAVLLMAGLPWLLSLSIVFRTVRADVPPWVREAVAGLIILLIFWMLLFAAFQVAGGPLSDLIRQLADRRAGTLVAWLVTTFLLLGGYALAQASFERIELPAKPGGKSGVLGLGGGSS